MNLAQIDYPGSQTSALPDATVMHEVNTWMTRKLQCVAGRREYRLGRYMIQSASRTTVPMILSDYFANLERGDAVACLMLFNEPDHYEGKSDVKSAFRFLAEQMALFTDIPADDLATGAALSTSVKLRCPVTAQSTVYDDFECIAFCPQSADLQDDLYDPLMYAPYPAVNISSDTYAYSRFVADSAKTLWGKEVYEETDRVRIAELLNICVDRWQRIATATIRNFVAVTDTSLCPVHVTDDERHWIAAHKDPAFAEQVKEAHSHELPVIYAQRIVDRWLAYFSGEKEYHATGVAREGVPA